MASSTLPPQVSVVLLGMSGFWGLHPRTVTVPPVLPPLALELVPGLSLPPPHAAASSATEATPATMVTVRVVPRIDVLLLKGSAVLNRTDRSGLLTGWSAAL